MQKPSLSGLGSQVEDDAALVPVGVGEHCVLPTDFARSLFHLDHLGAEV
jgi:hypothetical protein